MGGWGEISQDFIVSDELFLWERARGERARGKALAPPWINALGFRVAGASNSACFRPPSSLCVLIDANQRSSLPETQSECA